VENIALFDFDIYPDKLASQMKTMPEHTVCEVIMATSDDKIVH